jgi:hypothetical protein
MTFRFTPPPFVKIICQLNNIILDEKFQFGDLLNLSPGLLVRQ